MPLIKRSRLLPEPRAFATFMNRRRPDNAYPLESDARKTSGLENRGGFRGPTNLGNTTQADDHLLRGCAGLFAPHGAGLRKNAKHPQAVSGHHRSADYKAMWAQSR